MFKQHRINMKHIIKSIWILPLLFLPLCANALGVKEIKVFSALYQPLKARIGLISVKGMDPLDIRVKLAAPRLFKEAGIGRPYFLTHLKFKPIINPDGGAYIQVTSIDIVREPYLDFMLEISWRGGSIIKEYTVLLDPVIFQQASITPKKEIPKQNAAEQPPVKKQTYGPVKKAETLWGIAKKTRPGKSITIKQMINAIHRENPDAFVRGNVNLLKQGKILTIPDAQTLNSLKPYREQNKARKEQQPATTVIKEPVEKAPDTAREELSAEMVKPDAAATPVPAIEPEQTETPEMETTAEAKPEPEAAEPAEEAELKVVATPDEQLKTIMQPRDDKTYPKGQIEQLRESIVDTEEGISALGAINQDLVKLRAALQAKIRLVQEELNRTNQVIAIVSGKLETSEMPAEPKTDLTTEPTPIPEPEPAQAKPDVQTTEVAKAEQPAEPELSPKAPEELSPSVISKINEPEAKEPAGAEIKTDLAGIARINKLEQEIASLKSQSQMLEIQKYLIIFLAIAFLIAISMIIGSNRKNRLATKRGAQKPEPDISGQSYPSQYDVITEDNTTHRKQHEAPSHTTHANSYEVISHVEHPTTLSNHFGHQAADEPESDTEEQSDDLPTANAILFESSHNETNQDVDSIITTVDVYLAYRRLTEAESILHNAIDNHPELPELKAKLLEIYAFNKDAKLFTRYLERYQEELSSKVPKRWDNILTMAVQLIPDHPYVADVSDGKTDEDPLADSDTDAVPDTSQIDTEPDSLMDELVIGDIQTPEDELFKVEQDEPDSFDIDLDMDEFNKS